MAGFTTELKVGLLTVAAVAVTIWGILRTDDRPPGALEGYTLYALVPSAEGLYPSTQVRVAGVSVGMVKAITLEKGRAKLELEMSGDMQLPKDSTVDLRSEGVLGDKFVRVTPGRGDLLLADGDTIEIAPGGDALEDLKSQALVIAANVTAITEALRLLIEDPELRIKMMSTLENLDAVSASLREITEANRAEVEIVAKNLIELSATLNRLADRASVSVDKEMSAIREVTKKIDDTLVHVNNIAARIDAGEGTIGRLVTDSSTIDRINSTVGKVDDALGDITSMQMDVTYDGAVYFGSDPDEPGFTQNPMAGEAKSTLGLRVLPREDYGYILGLTSHPYGSLKLSEHVYTDSGASYTEVERTDAYRLTFQFMKRWGPAAFRLGVKEGSGGVGADLYLARDRVSLSADLYDLEYGSWPLLDGTPNLTLGLRASPWRHVYLGGGLDNVLFNARHGFTTGYLGGGFWFTDDDIRWIIGSLPLPG